MQIVIKEILEAGRKHKEINKICESLKSGENKDTVTVGENDYGIARGDIRTVKKTHG